MISKIVSHYEILEKLGEGGMGEVYLTQDLKLKHNVVIKCLSHHLTKSESDKKRSLREAQAAAALNHPNICVIFEIQDEDDLPFIVKEYVHSQTLREKYVLDKSIIVLPFDDMSPSKDNEYFSDGFVLSLGEF